MAFTKSNIGEPNLSSVVQGKVNRIIHEIATGTIENGTAKVTSFAPVAFTINSLKVAVDSGSCTIDVEINGTGVTGMTNLSVTSTPLTATATALNSVSVDDEVTIVISNNSSAIGFGLTLQSSED